MFAGRPQVVYESPVGDGGRLISPCRCKGSQKYVHEECLQGWRHADPGYGRRNYWQCPTCKYKYRLQRMTWGRYISSTFAQLLLTVGIFWVAVFLLGFVADPIINLYVDPVTTLSNPKAYAFEESIILDNEPTWAEHMVKGFASLGLLGFVKVVITMSPFHWLNLRGTGFLRGRNGGRDRMNNISWVVVLLGIFTFLYVSSVLVRAPRSLLTSIRRSSKASALGVSESLRMPGSVSWTSAPATTMMMSNDFE